MANQYEREMHQLNDIEAFANATEPKSIININYDCLEQIFDFLDLESLLNVAQTCKQLQVAAATKFGHKYGKKSIYLYRITRDTIYRCEPGVRTPFGPIRVNGLKFCFPFLRCFGGGISYLEVDYNNVADEQKGNLDRYINQYCGDSLIGFSFRNGHIFSRENFIRPFKCVEKIRTSYFNFGRSMSNFVYWFPNLQQLGMIRITIDENAIAVTFPNMTHFSIFIQKNNRHDFTHENTVSLLRANPQLENLEIYFFEFGLNELLNMIDGNPSVTRVLLDGDITNMNAGELERFRNEHPLIAKLDIKNSIAELD